MNTINFYRQNKNCGNTGELSGVIIHEWGHGLDDNDNNGRIAKPSGEGIADAYAALRMVDSCIGRGFWKSNGVCTGKFLSSTSYILMYQSSILTSYTPFNECRCTPDRL